MLDSNPLPDMWFANIHITLEQCLIAYLNMKLSDSYKYNRGQDNSLWAKSGPMPVKNKVLLTHSLVICLGIDYGCFGAAVVEFSSCNRDHVAHRRNIFTICPVQKRFAKSWYIESRLESICLFWPQSQCDMDNSGSDNSFLNTLIVGTGINFQIHAPATQAYQLPMSRWSYQETPCSDVVGEDSSGFHLPGTSSSPSSLTASPQDPNLPSLPPTPAMEQANKGKWRCSLCTGAAQRAAIGPPTSQERSRGETSRAERWGQENPRDTLNLWIQISTNI